jgi:hypothetical protein
MRIAYFEPLSRAWDRTRVILWQPFDLVKWLVLAFAAWLAGLTTDSGIATTWRSDADELGRGPWLGMEHAWEELAANVVWIPLIILLIMAALAVAVLVLWVSSRAKFIFLDGLVRNRAEIVEPWNRFATLGNSLFLWRLCFSLACGIAVVVALLAFFAPAAGLSVHDALAGLSVAAGFFGVLALIVIAVVAAYIGLFTEAFVIPIMYRFDIKVMEAWRALLPWLRARPAHFVLYGLFILLLGTIFALFFSVFCLATCCMAAMPYLGTVLLLPIWVAYRLLSVEFLAQFHRDFDLHMPLPEVDGVIVTELE